MSFNFCSPRTLFNSFFTRCAIVSPVRDTNTLCGTAGIQYMWLWYLSVQPSNSKFTMLIFTSLLANISLTSSDTWSIATQRIFGIIWFKLVLLIFSIGAIFNTSKKWPPNHCKIIWQLQTILFIRQVFGVISFKEALSNLEDMQIIVWPYIPNPRQWLAVDSECDDSISNTANFEVSSGEEQSMGDHWSTWKSSSTSKTNSSQYCNSPTSIDTPKITS